MNQNDGGVSVGVLLVPRNLIQSVKSELDRICWIKKGRNTAKIAKIEHGTDLFETAIPLTPVGNLAIASFTEQVPEKIRDWLEKGQIKHQIGVRLGPKSTTNYQSANQEDPKKEETSIPKFTFIELFCGIGGFRIGCELVGGRSVFASEIDEQACFTYYTNFNSKPSGDITEIDSHIIPPHDVLTAGFPCQSFSVMGNQRGLQDPRGNLFWEIIRIAQHHKPKVLLLENVPGLLSNEGGATFDVIETELNKINYDIKISVINSSSFVPQDRDRLYIVGFRRDLVNAYNSFQFPILPPNSKKLIDILEDDVSPTLTLTDHQWNKITSSSYYKSHPTGRLADRNGLARCLRANYKTGYLLCSQFISQEEGKNPRFFSPREVARLQGFPESFKIPGDQGHFYRQAGNAVCPYVVESIMRAVMDALEANEKCNEEQLTNNENK
eukprot:TRINITY_DN3078_c0_g1_i2.p1 TRINITY_DN3078_c0_g1~~TRINITY_DN3078_c0_g1_i2.p1  ORF type:complete len:439 (-),score=72.62 TRINITY_DN3078_c0_g1_i2:846-2162(-)